MKRYALYRRSNGQIVGLGVTNHDELADVCADPEVAPIEVTADVSFDTHYIMNGQVAYRPAFPATVSKAQIAADGIDMAAISKLPDPCRVRVDGEMIDLTGGVLTLSAETDATYVVSCRHFPYRDWQVTIVAKSGD